MDNRETTALSVIDILDVNASTRNMETINLFRQAVQRELKPGHDYGIIPGTSKPTLFKPGAEKIVMMMGLSSRFEIMVMTEDYDKGFFAYNIKCILSRSGMDICEGVGNCNSREGKYIKQDPYTIANTILKMAKKRAYVDAALSVASLSDIFTQDLEDMPDMMVSNGGPSHRDNQGKPLLEQQITFGKHKGSTFKELLETQKGYLRWLAYESGNQKWAPIAKEVLEQYSEDSNAGGGSDKPSNGLACADCGQVVTEAIKTYSEKNFGKSLCRECQENAKQNNTQPEYELSDIEFMDSSAPY